MSDLSTSLERLQPAQQLFATGCYKAYRGTPLCAPKKLTSLCTRPCCVRRAGIKRVTKASSLTSCGVYAAVSAVMLRDALRLHSGSKVEDSSKFKLGVDIVLLLIRICILSSSFSLSLFTVMMLQLNATSVMGKGQGNNNFCDNIFIDTQVGLATFLLSIYLLLAAHCWLLWERARGPHGMTRALSVAATIGITMLRFTHAHPPLRDCQLPAAFHTTIQRRLLEITGFIMSTKGTHCLAHDPGLLQ